MTRTDSPRATRRIDVCGLSAGWRARVTILAVLPLAVLFISSSAHASNPPGGSYTATCTGAYMGPPNHGKDPTVPATTLYANCTDFFSNHVDTSLDNARDCDTNYGINNVNGHLRCVLYQVPISITANTAPYPFLDVVSLTTTQDQTTETKVWRIDQPNPTVGGEPLWFIHFFPDDVVSFKANGCVQTGGSGHTWKNYVHPYNPDNVDEYYGRVQIPGAPGGIGQLQRLADVMSSNQEDFAIGDRPSYLIVGYQDEAGDYGDNGYWGHDDGDNGQCAASLPDEAGGPAWLEITVKTSLKFTLMDVSPNFEYGGQPAGDDAAGRIKGLIIDPSDDSILYAAAEMSGIWRSTDSGRSWHHASNKLQNGFAVSATSLAADDKSPKGKTRLLFAAGDDDGRPGNPSAGLWISDDGADTWKHVDLKCGSSNQIDISSVAFSAGQPFVSTACGIWTTTNSDLTNSAQWTTTLAEQVFNGDHVTLATLPGHKALFACKDKQVVRSLDFVSWDKSFSILDGNCLGLSVVPIPQYLPPPTKPVEPSIVAVIHSTPPSQGSTKQGQEVTILNMNDGSTTNLKFSQVANEGGSGLSNVYTPPLANPLPLPGIPAPLPPSPLVQYDVYAADGFTWFAYNGNGGWSQLTGGGNCGGSNPVIHVDTWDMAFPRSYDPQRGTCSAFATTDGGVFTNSQRTPNASCARDKCWVTAQSGIHAMEVSKIAGVPSPQMTAAALGGPFIYEPTGDNDVWVTTNGGLPTFQPLPSWQALGDRIGDAGQALIDPLYPYLVVSSRNEGGVTPHTHGFEATAPPWTGGGDADVTPPVVHGKDFQSPGSGDFQQIMTFPGHHNANARYASVETSSTQDAVVFNLGVNLTANPLNTGQWKLLSNDNPFKPDEIIKIQVAGLDSSGDSVCSAGAAKNTDKPAMYVYVLTKEGAVQRAEVGPEVNGSGTLVGGWKAAGGSGATALKNVVNLIANPFDPTELYAADIGDKTIKYSNDCGENWKVQNTLTDIATNHGEFVFDCNSPYDSRGRGRFGASSFITHGCALGDIAFDVFHTDIRVAVLYPGGVAFSRDHGKEGSWIPIDINMVSPNDLRLYPVSVFYDGETDPIMTTIYLGVHGSSMRAIRGPFPIMTSTPEIK